jgi:peptidoglycan/LPS O-acetylase OafA/YrhL
MVMPQSSSGRADRSMGHAAGLDLIRLFAIALVTIQHTLSLTDHDAWATWGPINVGQLGVSLFLGVSGHLSMAGSKTPVAWLLERGRRLYPPYFIVMCASFALTWASGYKTFGPGQVVSQLLMLGLFTHPGHLVNVPTWFMSLLLVGYLAIFLVRLAGRPTALIWMVVGLVLGFNALTGQRWPWFELSTFFLAAGLATVRTHRSVATLLMAALLLFLAWWSPPLIYSSVVLALLTTSRLVRRLPAVVSVSTEYVYGYYLIHGIMLAGFLVVFRAHPVPAVFVAVVAAAQLAVLLRMVTERVFA